MPNKTKRMVKINTHNHHDDIGIKQRLIDGDCTSRHANIATCSKIRRNVENHQRDSPYSTTNDNRVKHIITEILQESGIDADRVRFALENKERVRKFCVQYRETDLNFISRLVEEEGIYYFFEHYDNKHVVVFSDSKAAYLPLPGARQITFNTSNGMTPDKESVYGFIYSRRANPAKVTQRDFNYKRIDLDLTTEMKTNSPSRREVYDFPGNYFKQERGNQLAEIRHERLQVLGETAEGESNCPRLGPGYEWELTDHYHKGKYLTVAVIHSGSQPQVLAEQAGGGGFSYGNEFLVIPSNVMVRPHVVAEKPAITGLQTWTVVGRPGEEICTDEYGRIKAQPPWDRLGKHDDRSSCWLRVAQTWGGGARGGQFIPRIGDEVLVAFMEGDPDRPIVVGSVYNGDNLPINSLKKSVTQSGFRTKTHKGEGFHELRFDDAKGAEEIYLRSEKDWNILIKNNKGQSIGGSSSTNVEKSLLETAEDITLTANSKITLVCGASTIIIDPSGISIKGGKINLNE